MKGEAVLLSARGGNYTADNSTGHAFPDSALST